MATIIVQKYGGSSVKDTRAIQKVAKRVIESAQKGHQVVVVVSAMAKTTDGLLARANEISESPSRRELDMLLSCGERASMALLSMAIQAEGYQAISLTGSQCGIITNDRHSGARIIEVRPIRVQDELENGNIVIVAGFQGISYKKEVTTLGRGGSDTTAVALAAALEAEYCEICSDVDGVYSADPRLVDGATMLQAITHDEMLELATHGAKVLHPGCVEIAKQSKIALYARATAKLGGGTRIDIPGVRENVDVIGVSGQKKLVRLRASGADCVDEILSFCARVDLPALHLDTDMNTADMWFSLLDLPDWKALKKTINSEKIEIIEGLGAVSIVGDHVGGDSSRLAGARTIARSQGTEILAMSSSPLRISLFCEEASVDALVKALHHEFIEKVRGRI